MLVNARPRVIRWLDEGEDDGQLERELALTRRLTGQSDAPGTGRSTKGSSHKFAVIKYVECLVFFSTTSHPPKTCCIT